MSRVVTDLVAGKGLKFSERGSHERRGLPGRWDLFAASAKPAWRHLADVGFLANDRFPPEAAGRRQSAPNAAIGMQNSSVS